MQRAIRWVFFMAIAVVLGLYMHRSRRTPEETELTAYVESLPRFTPAEDAIHAGLDRLQKAPGLPPEAARALLVDEIIPRLLQLRAQAGELHWSTPTVDALAREYLAVLDAQIDACRTCVRVIDEPKLDQKTAIARVTETFTRASEKRSAWRRHVEETCRAHGLVKPIAR